MFSNIINKLFGLFSKSSSVNRELYVGNINYQVKPHELRKLFEKYGSIESLKIIRDPRTKRSKGYGFVKFKKQNDAVVALKKTNSMSYRGRELCVDYANEQ